MGEGCRVRFRLVPMAWLSMMFAVAGIVLPSQPMGNAPRDVALTPIGSSEGRGPNERSRV